VSAGPRFASSKLLRALLDSGARAGVDVAAVTASLGVHKGTLDDPHGWVSADQMSRAWQTVPDASGDPAFGLRAGAETPPGVYGPLDLATMSSPTVADALERMVRYYRLVGAMSALSLSRAADGAGTLRVRLLAPTQTDLRHYFEHIFALVVTRIRLVTVSAREDWSVSFRHAAPSDRTTHTRILGARVRFSQPEDALVIGGETMRLELRTASPALSAMLEAEEARVTTRADAPIDARVRSALVTTLRDGDASLAGVARRLSMSPRTVQRALGGAGTTFAAVLDGVRRDAAERHLAEGKLSVGEIAFSLGFSQASAFHRAFKRWTGRTPLDRAQRG
jgi:AraC-like DNA-binding protein